MVVKGRTSFFIGDGAPFEAPLVVLAIDTSRRDPRDITFVNPADGTPDTFIRAL